MRRILAALALSIALAAGLAPGFALAAETNSLKAASPALATQDAASYGIWVGGVEVTSENAANVTGAGIEGSVSYDASTSTLTLNGATITGSHMTYEDGGGAYGHYARKYSYFGIFGGDSGGTDLTVKLIGTNKVLQDDGSTGDFREIYGIGNVADLTFTGSGTLQIENDCSDENVGIDCGVLTVDSKASVNVVSTASSYNSTGASVGAATIKGSLVVSARSGTQYAVGLISHKGVTVAKDGRLTAEASHGNSGMDAIIVRNGAALNVNGYVKATSGDWGITCGTLAVGPAGELEASGTERALSSDKVELGSNKLKVMTPSGEISASAIGSQQLIHICIPKTVSLSGANKLTKTKVTKTLKAASLKKKAATVALPTAKFGKVAWKVSAKDKKKVLTLAKSGKVKVKKGAKAGTYTIKLKANVKGTKNYNALKNKVVTVKVKVK